MRVLIIGGAGFIGINTAFHFLNKGYEVAIFDNLSRPGSQLNLNWLKKQYSFDFSKGDVSDYSQVQNFMSSYPDTRVIFPLAAQVAVTTSCHNPRLDFQTNALGTFNILESVRKTNFDTSPLLIYSSTNKVYGKLSHAKIQEGHSNYKLVDPCDGIGEETPLQFYSPYGCSKGSGDQYVLDYTAIYGLKATSFRQSCIYGYRQFGVEDQGWVAWFLISALLDKPITIYGNGKQVRDVLFIDDLLEAYAKAVENPDRVCGQAYNVGGGVNNQLSLLEFIVILEKLLGKKITLHYSDWRPGDQKIYVSNIQKMSQHLNWTPKFSPDNGIRLLYSWVKKNIELFNYS